MLKCGSNSTLTDRSRIELLLPASETSVLPLDQRSKDSNSIDI